MIEIWKDIGVLKGVDFTGYYQISNLGRIKSLERWRSNGNGGYIQKERILKNAITRSGKNNCYARCHVSLRKEKKRIDIRVHRLVTLYYIPNPENKPEVNHIDSNALNNYVDNLEWATSLENSRHALMYGGLKPNYDEKEIVKDILSNEYTPIEIRKNHNLKNRSVYYNICRRNNIDTSKIKYNGCKYKLDLDELLEDLKKGKTNMELKIKYNCSSNLIATRKYQFRKRGLLRTL